MDFHSLARRDLQALCKRNGVRANMTNAAMADALAALDLIEGLEEYREQIENQSSKKMVEEEEPDADADEKEMAASPLPRARRVTAKSPMASSQRAAAPAAEKQLVPTIRSVRNQSRRTHGKDENEELPTPATRRATRRTACKAAAAEKDGAEMVSATPALGHSRRIAARKEGAAAQSVKREVSYASQPRRTTRSMAKNEIGAASDETLKNSAVKCELFEQINSSDVIETVPEGEEEIQTENNENEIEEEVDNKVELNDQNYEESEEMIDRSERIHEQGGNNEKQVDDDQSARSVEGAVEDIATVDAEAARPASTHEIVQLNNTIEEEDNAANPPTADKNTDAAEESEVVIQEEHQKDSADFAEIIISEETAPVPDELTEDDADSAEGDSADSEEPTETNAAQRSSDEITITEETSPTEDEADYAEDTEKASEEILHDADDAQEYGADSATPTETNAAQLSSDEITNREETAPTEHEADYDEDTVQTSEVLNDTDDAQEYASGIINLDLATAISSVAAEIINAKPSEEETDNPDSIESEKATNDVLNDKDEAQEHGTLNLQLASDIKSIADRPSEFVTAEEALELVDGDKGPEYEGNQVDGEIIEPEDSPIFGVVMDDSLNTNLTASDISSPVNGKVNGDTTVAENGIDQISGGGALNKAKHIASVISECDMATPGKTQPIISPVTTVPDSVMRKLSNLTISDEQPVDMPTCEAKQMTEEMKPAGQALMVESLHEMSLRKLKALYKEKLNTINVPVIDEADSENHHSLSARRFKSVGKVQMGEGKRLPLSELKENLA